MKKKKVNLEKEVNSALKGNKKAIIYLVALAIFVVAGLIYGKNAPKEESRQAEINEIQSAKFYYNYSLANVPEYTSEPSVVINENVPEFTDNDYTTIVFENYSPLDALGRCGVAFINACTETIPKENEKREDISSVKPSGFINHPYDATLVEGNYIYNRCHLIAYSIGAENVNKENLITGTRYMNTKGMLPYEEKIVKYIKSNPDKHVLYRVTPIYTDNNLVANGVQMEASSVEDKGASLKFNVYCYNVQPGIVIDYATGENHLP